MKNERGNVRKRRCGIYLRRTRQRIRVPEFVYESLRDSVGNAERSCRLVVSVKTDLVVFFWRDRHSGRESCS